MGETKDQIENQIDDARQDLGANLQELERKVKSVTDWKHYYAKSPMTMVGAAFGAGLLLAAMSGNKSHRPRRRLSSSRSLASYDPADGLERPKNKSMETWHNIKGALAGVMATRVKDYVSEIVPGFQEHYDRSQRQSQGIGSSPGMDPHHSM